MQQPQHIDVCKKLDELEKTLGSVMDVLLSMKASNNALGDFVSQRDAMLITGLSKSQLHKMRQDGRLSESSLAVKTPWYRLSDFKKLLENNEKNR